MQSFTDILILFLMGGLGGFMAGMLGIGGGIVYVLIFTHYLEVMGVSETDIVPAIIANSMFAIFCAGISGTYKQWRNDNFHPREILISGVSASAASILFSYLISLGHWYTRERFTIVFILLLIVLGYKIYTGKEPHDTGSPEKLSDKKFAGIGFLAGIIAAFSGIGGGVIMVPFFTNLMNIRIKKATALSLGVIMTLAFLTSLFNMFIQKAEALNIENSFGYIAFSLAIPVGIGSLICSPLGVSLANRFSPRTIRILFTIFLVIVIIKMVYGLVA